MAWNPIALTVPQYENPNGIPYSGAVLKAYDVGTTINIPMATDSSGTTTVGSIALDSNGYPEVGGAVVIPHIDQNYKLALYPTQAAADADSGAIWTIDNIAIGDELDEWVETGDSLTFVSSNSFSVPGDQAARYIVGRRIEITDIGGIDYYTIQATTFSATMDTVTTVQVVGDNGATLASGALSARFSIFRPVQESKSDPNTSLPIYDTQALALVGGAATVWPGPSLWFWAGATESLATLTDIAIGFPVTILHTGATSQVLTITASAGIKTPEGRDIPLYEGQSVTLMQTGTSPAVYTVLSHSGRRISIGESVTTDVGNSIDLLAEDGADRFPPGLTRINVLFTTVSTDGVSPIQVQLGDSGGFEAAGYFGRTTLASLANEVAWSNAIPIHHASVAGETYSGVIQLFRAQTETWRIVVSTNNQVSTAAWIGAGSKAMAPGPVDRLRIICGADTFSTGVVHVEYE